MITLPITIIGKSSQGLANIYVKTDVQHISIFVFLQEVQKGATEELFGRKKRASELSLYFILESPAPLRGASF